jgi:hypothetical protein
LEPPKNSPTIHSQIPHGTGRKVAVIDAPEIACLRVSFDPSDLPPQDSDIVPATNLFFNSDFSFVSDRPALKKWIIQLFAGDPDRVRIGQKLAIRIRTFRPNAPALVRRFKIRKGPTVFARLSCELYPTEIRTERDSSKRKDPELL